MGEAGGGGAGGSGGKFGAIESGGGAVLGVLVVVMRSVGGEVARCRMWFTRRGETRDRVRIDDAT